MMSIDTYLTFVAVCMVAIIVPGPTNTLIVANAMRHGARAGLLNVAGTQVGLALMLATAGIGLASIIEATGHWFEWIKLAGAAYLVWIGIQMFRAGGRHVGETVTRHPRGGFFLQGLLVALGNPKQLLFFGALLPQFIDPAGNHLAQVALLGATALFFAAVSDGAYALASGRLARTLTARRAGLISRASGLFLIGGGVWLALAKER